MAEEAQIPTKGGWPVDPQDDLPISKDRIWVDGCFDFSHHGHAGALLQARRLGQELVVGIHSDDEILSNKGPTVMTLSERVAAVNACRFITKSVPCAPYVTSLPWVSHYGCYYVAHGDDITSDSNGEDCYRFVKAAGRFKVFKRTPGISTTDLVGRMLLCTRSHFIKSLSSVLAGEEGPEDPDERRALAREMNIRIRDYASDESGFGRGPEVWSWNGSDAAMQHSDIGEAGTCKQLVVGNAPKPGQHVIYVDGGFDLFSSGHIEFLRLVIEAEEEEGHKREWYTEAARRGRMERFGEDYGPVFVLAGIHDDKVINYWKGVNYPIMNIFERGLCVLQCKYIHAVIFSAPFSPSKLYLNALPYGTPSAVYHGPTSFMPLTYDPYIDAKEMGIYREIGMHKYQHVNAGEIVQRILNSRARFEERQRIKAEKAAAEEAARRKEVADSTAGKKR